MSVAPIFPGGDTTFQRKVDPKVTIAETFRNVASQWIGKILWEPEEEVTAILRSHKLNK
jgi:hypothetical protein